MQHKLTQDNFEEHSRRLQSAPARYTAARKKWVATEGNTLEGKAAEIHRLKQELSASKGRSPQDFKKPYEEAKAKGG